MISYVAYRYGSKRFNELYHRCRGLEARLGVLAMHQEQQRATCYEHRCQCLLHDSSSGSSPNPFDSDEEEIPLVVRENHVPVPLLPDQGSML